jgi:acetyl-CoA acetyltransferase
LTLGLAQGAEGARKLVTLTHQLRVGKLRYGVAALEADGIGLALVLENLP